MQISDSLPECAPQQNAYDDAVAAKDQALQHFKDTVQDVLAACDPFPKDPKLGAALGLCVGKDMAKGIKDIRSAAATAAFCLAATAIAADLSCKAAVKKSDEAEAAYHRAEAAVDKAAARLQKCLMADAGCGSRGGPGYRRADGKCAGWHDWGSEYGDESATAYA